MDPFNTNFGFGEHKPQAIKLLQTTINILNEFDINHFLISGTLLGHIRHNDFIPWDDDIDILVDSSLIEKKEAISLKYGNINIFYKSRYDSIKICFNGGQEIPDPSWEKNSIQGLIPTKKGYFFPFVDMFIYESGPNTHICGSTELILIDGKLTKMFLPFSGACNRCFRFILEHKMVFFHNDWNKKDFFPPQQIEFLGIKCNIPRNPHKFLVNNYGPDYMTIIESPVRIHKTNTKVETIIKSKYVRN